MIILYVIVATIFIILEGVFPYHWHGFVIPGDNKKTFNEYIRKSTPLFVIREYFLNISMAIIGWVSGYYLFFNISVFNGDNLLIIGAFVIFLLGATGYLPNFIVNRIGSLRG